MLPSRCSAGASQRYAENEATLAALCDTITRASGHEGGFWQQHLDECKELIVDKEQAFLATVQAVAALVCGSLLLRHAKEVLMVAVLRPLMVVWRQIRTHPWVDGAHHTYHHGSSTFRPSKL